MTLPSDSFTAPAPAPAPALDAAPALDPDELRDDAAPFARAVLAHALALGVAADLLLRDGFAGLGFPVWLALLALSALSLVWRGGRRLPREAAAWLVTAMLFGAAMAWRNAGFLLLLDVLATLFALGRAAIALGDARAARLAARLRDTD